MDVYARIRHHSTSGLENQRNVSLSVWVPFYYQKAAALLAAVEETIRERGLELSPTAYFANLVS